MCIMALIEEYLTSLMDGFIKRGGRYSEKTKTDSGLFRRFKSFFSRD